MGMFPCCDCSSIGSLYETHEGLSVQGHWKEAKLWPAMLKEKKIHKELILNQPP